MKPYRLRELTIRSDPDRVFDYIADATNLPDWTHAFSRVDDGGGRATLRTPDGEVEVGLEVRASREYGTVDWRMTFPDGSVGRAFSRVIDLGGGTTQYGFVLTAPPVPLEQLEGTLDDQARTLTAELATLRSILEREPRARRAP